VEPVMLYLTRKFTFSAAHRLHSPALTTEQNACAYGLCENVHGHNYRLQVTVRGTNDPTLGFFCNVLELASTVQGTVVDLCEHRLLNDVPLFAGITTTMENLAGRIWQALERPLKDKGMELHEVVLGETDDHWVTIRADDIRATEKVVR
jgi:6-pyruvoyltetrahydropterin/6-carboxytetrahydropterin synthase